MALAAHPVGERRMYCIVQQSSLIGAVGVVARRTALFCHRIFHMLVHKGRPVCLMALQAKRRHRVLKKKIRFCRGVRIVAVEAALFHRIMFEFDFLHGFAHVFVTAEAKLVPSLQEMKLVV